MDTEIAQKTFEVMNDMEAIDKIYEFDGPAQQQILRDKPWTREYVEVGMGRYLGAWAGLRVVHPSLCVFDAF